MSALQQEVQGRTGLLRSSEYICLPHYRLLAENAPSHLSKQPLSSFNEDIINLTKKHLEELYNDVHAFTKTFDYRSVESGEKVSENVKKSIERACEFLCAELGE